MRASKVFAVIVTSSIGLAIACGGNVIQDDSCGSFVDALTAMFQQCGIQAPMNSDSRAAFVAYCNALAGAPGAKDVDVQYAACTKNLNPSICAGPQCGPRGTLAAGAACTDYAQCQSGFCIPASSAGPNTEQTCGTCGALGEQGASCGTSTNVVCDVQAELSCSTNETCQPIPPAQPLPTKGQPCTTTCTAAYACINGVCSDRLGPGSPCPTGNDCQLDDVCNPLTHVCSAKVGAGVSCDVPPDFNACDGLVCTGGSHVCEAPKPLGASCVVGNFECATGLWCTNGQCELPDFTVCK